MEATMSSHQTHPQKASLKIVRPPAIGSVVSAPPILKVSDNTVHYACGHCGAVLLHAEHGQVRNLIICCTMCGSYNSTDD
jgi:hypothetical protein